jgi:uncharacterized membrane protein YozB (DUF420 family)
MSGGDFFGDLRDLYQEVIWIMAASRAIFAGWKMRTAPHAGITRCAVTAWSFS